MTEPQALAFDQPQLQAHLQALSAEALNDVAFGIIGIDAQGIVQRYNTWEQKAAGLTREQAMGLHLFGVVAQCMNNFMVAQRFEDTAAAGVELDETINYTLTLRMRPARVRLRLLAKPGEALRFVCIDRRT